MKERVVHMMASTCALSVGSQVDALAARAPFRPGSAGSVVKLDGP